MGTELTPEQKAALAAARRRMEAERGAGYDELMAKSRELMANGDAEGARRLAKIALQRRRQTTSASAPGNTVAANMTPEERKQLTELFISQARGWNEELGLGSQPKGVGQSIREFLLGDNDPTTQNLGERIGSALNKAGESMTMGLVGDETSAAIESLVPGVGYETRRDHYRDQEEVLERNNPGLALGADIGGAVLPAFLSGGTSLLPQGARLATRVGASGAAGAGMAGTYAFMEGEGGGGERFEDATDAAKIGAGVGAAVPFVGSGVQRLLDRRAFGRAVRDGAKNAPSTEELRAMGRALYDQVEDAGVSVRPDRVQATAQRISDMLRSEGADEILTPNTARVSRVFSEAGEGVNTVDFRELDRLRRIAGNAASANPANRPDTRLSTMAIQGLDDFVRNLGPDDIDAGDLQTLQEVLPKARDTWARMSRSQTIDDAIEASQHYLSGGSSGIRNQFSRILKSPSLSRGFSEAEKRAMERVINGSIPEKFLHLFGGGLGQFATIGGGVAAGSPAGLQGALVGGAAGAATAAGVRKASEALSNRNAEVVRALIANGGMANAPAPNLAARRVIESLMRRATAAAAE